MSKKITKKIIIIIILILLLIILFFVHNSYKRNVKPDSITIVKRIMKNKYDKIEYKFDKSKFFNPLIDYNKNIPNSSRESNYSQNYKSLKILKFPTISNSVNIRNRIKSTNKRKSIKSISKIKVNDYSFDKNDISEIISIFALSKHSLSSFSLLRCHRNSSRHHIIWQG